MATLTLEIPVMKKREKDAYLAYKDVKVKISELEKQVRVLKKEKDTQQKIFETVFENGVTEAKVGKIKVVKISQHRDVDAYSCDWFEYKER